MAMRAKFKLQEITKTHWGITRILMKPEYDPDSPEDQKFFRSTPSGELWMQIDNPVALNQLKLGQTFYLDFTPIDD